MKKIFFFLILLLVLGVAGYLVFNHYYNKIYGPSVSLNEDSTYFHIPTGSDFDDVKARLHDKGIVKDTAGFGFVARWMNYPNHIYPGRYLIEDKMSNRALITKLRKPDKSPVRLVIGSFKTIEELTSYAGKKLELDSVKLLELLNDEKYIAKYGFNKTDIKCMFIPDTYEFYWNTSASEFLEKLHKEYREFWNTARRQKAKAQGLNPKEVHILASIVQSESSMRAEWDTIAGVYLNRLKIGMALQADPTLKYILHQRGQTDIKRILNKHKDLNSPYNTYKYPGLPPGPLVMPEIPAIEAVLDPAEHNYKYFVAKPGNQKGHRFSTSLQQHNRYAREYRQYLNEQKIYR